MSEMKIAFEKVEPMIEEGAVVLEIDAALVEGKFTVPGEHRWVAEIGDVLADGVTNQSGRLNVRVRMQGDTDGGLVVVRINPVGGEEITGRHAFDASSLREELRVEHSRQHAFDAQRRAWEALALKPFDDLTPGEKTRMKAEVKAVAEELDKMPASSLADPVFCVAVERLFSLAQHPFAKTTLLNVAKARGCALLQIYKDRNFDLPWWSEVLEVCVSDANTAAEVLFAYPGLREVENLTNLLKIAGKMRPDVLIGKRLEDVYQEPWVVEVLKDLAAEKPNEIFRHFEGIEYYPWAREVVEIAACNDFKGAKACAALVGCEWGGGVIESASAKINRANVKATVAEANKHRDDKEKQVLLAEGILVALEGDFSVLQSLKAIKVLPTKDTFLAIFGKDHIAMMKFLVAQNVFDLMSFEMSYGLKDIVDGLISNPSSCQKLVDLASEHEKFAKYLAEVARMKLSDEVKEKAEASINENSSTVKKWRGFLHLCRSTVYVHFLKQSNTYYKEMIIVLADPYYDRDVVTEIFKKRPALAIKYFERYESLVSQDDLLAIIASEGEASAQLCKRIWSTKPALAVKIAVKMLEVDNVYYSALGDDIRKEVKRKRGSWFSRFI